MKWALALALLVGVAAVGTAVYVVVHNRDPVPNDISACVTKAGLTVAHNSAALGVARADVAQGALRPVRRWDFGRTDGVLLQPPDRSYAILALSNPSAPSLGGDVGRRVYEQPSAYPLVAVEDPVTGRLVRCANASR
ncbi:MAG TPA: hypothetical protein VMT10_13175 [Solirubrobacteraceae bacterium]|nr:hypothetical protein [Solirubrobacteraceae bacterium]